MADNPDQGESLPVELEDISPLRELALEAHELYLELAAVGFPERVLSQIMANMLYDTLTDTTISIEIDEDYDPEDDNDEREPE